MKISREKPTDDTTTTAAPEPVVPAIEPTAVRAAREAADDKDLPNPDADTKQSNKDAKAS